jgi:Domain of unknown function (DUF4942)
MELEILGEDDTFFAPTSSDAIDHLLAQYRQEESGIMKVQEIFVASEVKSALYFYLDGNQDRDINYKANTLIDTIFDVQSAKNSLTAAYWSKALALTDVADFMPQRRRNEWNEVLSAWRQHGYKRGKNPEKDMPEFNEETVRSTLQSLIVARSKFLAEKVDGCFTKLSRLHVTNQPEGFSKRIIMWYSSFSDLRIFGRPIASYQECGYLNDLRSIISRFMGNEDIPHGQTSDLIDALIKADRFNEWVSLDGNALRLKIFKKGTAHLEINPLMAQRLNMVLANLHPNAIPSEFRAKPDPKLVKDFGLMQKPLAVNVVSVINSILGTKDKGAADKRSFPLGQGAYGESRFAVDEALAILERLGGVIDGGSIAFDYDICDLVSNELNFTRCVPETKSHQFYPTPSSLSQWVMGMADIAPTSSILEPSAGVGGLLQHLPGHMAVNVTCVEVAKLHCAVLEQKGYGHVVCDDFLAFAKKTSYRWDRIIMNPPFSDGRALLHLNAAIGLLKEGGKLVAILPASYKNKVKASDCDVEYSSSIDNAFADASVSVIVCTVVKKAIAMAA